MYFNFHASEVCILVNCESHNQSASMDNKRVKFSPSTFAEIERRTVDRLVGTENRYEVPTEFQGRRQTTWDTLVAAFPVPVNVTIPSRIKQVGTTTPLYDCFLPPSFDCICYKCTTIMYPQVEYYHSIMEIQELQEPSVTPNVVEKAKFPHDMDRGIDPVLDCIVNVAHFYTDFVYVPGVSTVDECPATPTFSRVMFVTSDSPDIDARRRQQWVLRMTIVPTRLVF